MEAEAVSKNDEELEDMFFEASSEDRKRLRQEGLELYGKMEDIINKYKEDEESEEDEA